MGERFFVDILARTGSPAGGVAMGATLLDAFDEAGASSESYEWIYGPVERKEFPPHDALDGLTFDSWDDPLLLNNGSFPRTPYFFPGDHDGCVCDFAVTLVAQDDAAVLAIGEAAGLLSSDEIVAEEDSIMEEDFGIPPKKKGKP